MKYIITRDDDNKEEIFTFPDSVPHKAFAEAVSHMRNQMHGNWSRILREPVAAGFVESMKCVGRSESLNLNSRPQDSTILFSS